MNFIHLHDGVRVLTARLPCFFIAINDSIDDTSTQPTPPQIWTSTSLLLFSKHPRATLRRQNSLEEMLDFATAEPPPPPQTAPFGKPDVLFAALHASFPPSLPHHYTSTQHRCFLHAEAWLDLSFTASQYIVGCKPSPRTSCTGSSFPCKSPVVILLLSPHRSLRAREATSVLHKVRLTDLVASVASPPLHRKYTLKTMLHLENTPPRPDYFWLKPGLGEPMVRYPLTHSPTLALENSPDTRCQP